MKTNRVFQAQFAAALLLSTLNSQLSTARAQGSLTPPGAPTTTMKTLAQVEPRTPISSAPFTITNSGSYYLTTNLTVSSGDGITIAATGVTLDLNGFTIASTVASAFGYGILLNGTSGNITIFNGHIRSGVTTNGSGVYSGSGFGWGIGWVGSAPVNVVVSKVSVVGVLYDGIHLATGSANAVEACTVTTAGGYGIYASSIKGSVASGCGNSAIFGDQVTDCQGVSSGSYGVYAVNAHNCYGASTSGSGLGADTAENCEGISSNSIGVFASKTAQNCYGSSISNHGILAGTAQNCYGSSGAAHGISATVAANCYGTSSSGVGLGANTALNCRGYAYGSSPGLSAFMANSCYGNSTSVPGLSTTYGNFCFGSSVSVTTKYNMP
jgi:hypothetical protein